MPSPSGTVTPPSAYPRLVALLARLRRRERGVLLGRLALGAGAGFLAGLAVVGLAVARGWATPAYAWAWLSVLAVGAVAAAFPHARAWWKAAPLRRQAERVEAVEPSLRGALLTTLDRAERPMGSATLLERVASRTADVVDRVLPARVWSRRVWRGDALIFAGAGAAVLAVSVWAGRSPMALLLELLEPRAAQGHAAPVTPDGPRAVVGDITLRYLYPTYTRRDPVEIPNSNGAIHAPPGTRVEIRARTAERWPSAALRVYDRPPEPVEVVDGRALRAALDVGGEGIWRFEFGALPSPDYRIVPEPDLPPDVSVGVSTRALSASIDAALALPWVARDDYGLTEVKVEIDDGKQKRVVPLRALLDAPREARDDLRVTPKELGLAPGDEVRLRVGVWDNDAVAGAKPGWSAAIALEVLGPRGRHARTQRYRTLMRDALVLVLADFLVEPAPAVDAGEAAPGWAALADRRYEAFDRLVEEAWGGAEASSFDATLVRTLSERRRALFAFARNLGPKSGARDLESLSDTQSEHVEALEGAILMLDEVVRGAILEEALERVAELSDAAKELKKDLPKLDRAGALARLDRIARQLSQLSTLAAQLDEGALKEFLNERVAGAENILAEARKAVAEGRMDDAKALMERLAEQLEAMQRDLDGMRGRQQQQEDDRMAAMKQLREDIGALREDQQALRERTEAARERHGGDMEQAQKAWEEVERLARGVHDGLTELEGTLADFRAAAYANRASMDDTREESAGLLDSAQARDLRTARDRVERLAMALAMLERRTTDPRTRAALPDVAWPEAARALRAHREAAAKIREILDRMEEQQSTTSPELQQELRELAEQQQQVAEREQQVAERAEGLAGELPMDAPGLAEGTQRAAKQGERAEQAMREGRAMEAEGGQRAAEAGLKEAESALKEAEQNLREMQRQRRGGRQGEQDPGEEGEGEGSGEDQPQPAAELAIPAPEAFQTPEAYRKALLEGMSGDVPEEYRALNRRYYEELVRR